MASFRRDLKASHADKLLASLGFSDRYWVDRTDLYSIARKLHPTGVVWTQKDLANCVRSGTHGVNPEAWPGLRQPICEEGQPRPRYPFLQLFHDSCTDTWDDIWSQIQFPVSLLVPRCAPRDTCNIHRSETGVGNKKTNTQVLKKT